MSDSHDKLKEIQEELKWVTLREKTSFKEKLSSKGITGFLVPIGCFVTTGILAAGVYNMFKKNSKKQQAMMRYRVLAQGVTLALATIGIVNLKFSS